MRAGGQIRTRRTVFTGGQDLLRPPWSDEARIHDNCTSCGACLSACPEAILIAGPGKTPIVDFSRGECTFCTLCADACPEDVFDTAQDVPWTLTAQIDTGCMLSSGISCQLCTDSCDARALRMNLSHRPVGRIDLDVDACTGCGACVTACPVGAISVGPRDVPPSPEPVAAIPAAASVSEVPNV